METLKTIGICILIATGLAILNFLFLVAFACGYSATGNC